jgi:MFS family permease
MSSGTKVKLDRATLAAIPSGIWTLGFVSLLMDISSEMIHALLPVYLVTVLGASALTVGVVEGVAEATTSIAKVFSGVLSDWLQRRKILAVIGYGLAALTKPVFPLASTVGWIIAARFVDRVGKGIRGAPRDALIADIAPGHLRGAAFGLRQSLDTVGAFVGPGLAICLMWLSGNSFTTVFWIAVIPAVFCVVLLVRGVEEPDHPRAPAAQAVRLGMKDVYRLDRSYWSVVALGAIFSLARFSEAFLILRAQAAGLPIYLAPLALVVMNVVYALTAYPAGVISDGGNRTKPLALGLVFLIAADGVMAMATQLTTVMIGLALWGLHLGFTQGLLTSLVADRAPPDLRGTAFGIFNLVTGVALLAASVMAGALWDNVGPRGTFVGGAVFAALTLFVLLMIKSPGPPSPSAGSVGQA